MKEYSRLLIDEPPLMLQPSLAKLIGLNEAIVLQQIHYWIVINRKTKQNFINGRTWVYNSFQEWHENNFDFWSPRTVKTIFGRLREKGFILVANHNRQKTDRRLWYTIDYDKLHSAILALSIVQGSHTCIVQELPNVLLDRDYTEIPPNPPNDHSVLKEEKKAGKKNKNSKTQKDQQGPASEQPSSSAEEKSNGRVKVNPDNPYFRILPDGLLYEDFVFTLKAWLDRCNIERISYSEEQFRAVLPDLEPLGHEVAAKVIRNCQLRGWKSIIVDTSTVGESTKFSRATAIAAWNEVLVNGSRWTWPDDEVSQQIIRDMGGMTYLKGLSEAQEPFARNRFIEEYINA